MKLFAFDTALGACSVSCFVDGAEQATHFEPMSRGHAEVLMDHVARVEDAAGLSVAQADSFAVTVGPGTFTGVRVGLAAAKAFALATSKPLLGVSTLQALAAQVQDDLDENIDTIAVAIDARRGQLYFQMLDRHLAPITEPAAQEPSAVVATLVDHTQAHNVRMIGSGASIAAALMTEAGASLQVDAQERQPSAREVARIASQTPIDQWPSRISPLYLRPPDAKPQKPSSFVQKREKNA